MRRFFYKVFSSREDISARRVIGFLSFFVMCIIALTVLFTNLTIDEFIYDSFFWMTLGNMGLTTLDGWRGRKGIPKITVENADNVNLTEKENEEGKSRNNKSNQE